MWTWLPCSPPAKRWIRSLAISPGATSTSPQQRHDALAQEGGSFNIIHAGSGGKVDVFVGRDDFARERLRRRIPDEVLGISTWVATPEDVILAKLHWRLASRSEIQWRDCVEIAATQDLDLPYMRSWANRLGIEDDLRELVHAVETG